ncbi:protein translocase subunit SecF [Nocardioides sp. MAH-18]|uniref:Protein-export membrane protein SecF n=1 Tax=Nocardioides agri TaxID=2682843 RepID=A0A6L6XLZ0_9ACTN|nr:MULTISPECIES: protein translocase subunit SecF [unclassified Nocardioides]MBA2953058.1 protein translocase subunit SecF [Nocardioides sp. CGMCC 1.13656]MVQ47928.1 protein translocase subunit SecF [Nocardioides sp. MAH-18]
MGKFSRLGNDLYNGKRSIDFIGRRWTWYAVSGVLLLVSLLGLGVKGLDMGIEFVGGAEYKVSLPADEATQETADEVRDAVAATGIDAAQQPVVTTSGDSGLIVQVKPVTTGESKRIKDTIVETTGVDPGEISVQEIGPSWGQEIAKRSAIGLAVFLVLVVLFIWAYFREWKMSVAAIVALLHDILITIGVYALSGFEVTPATVTGLLTILGFSLYDTVVVFDKVRENTRNLAESRTTYAKAANLAVNQTLVRSINTSIVALIPVGAILYVGAVQLGASTLKDLALALFVGMAVGAYSSIFIATPLVVQLKANETYVQQAEKRDRARLKALAADPYATVPVFTDDMPVREDDAEAEGDLEEGAPVSQPPAPAQQRSADAANRGRIAPQARGPVKESRSAGRQQPSRQSKSKREKK